MRPRSEAFPNRHFQLQFGDWNKNLDVPCSIADRLSGFRHSAKPSNRISRQCAMTHE